MNSNDGTPDGPPAPAANGVAHAGSNGVPKDLPRFSDGRVDIGRVMLERPDVITDALARATEDARRESRFTGVPLVFWRDGKVSWEDADGNPVPEPDWARRFRETGEPPPRLVPRPPA